MKFINYDFEFPERLARFLYNVQNPLCGEGMGILWNYTIMS